MGIAATSKRSPLSIYHKVNRSTLIYLDTKNWLKSLNLLHLLQIVAIWEFSLYNSRQWLQSKVNVYLPVHISNIRLPPSTGWPRRTIGQIFIEERIQWPTRISRFSVSSAVTVLRLPPGSRSFLLPKATRTNPNVAWIAVKSGGPLVVQKAHKAVRHHDRCSRQFVPNVVRNARYLSNRGRGNRSIAASATAHLEPVDRIN